MYRLEYGKVFRTLGILAFVPILLAGCNAVSETSEETSFTSESVSSTTESTVETTVYTDETAVIVDYEPVDYLVLDEPLEDFHNYNQAYEFFWGSGFQRTDVCTTWWSEVSSAAEARGNGSIKENEFPVVMEYFDENSSSFTFGMDDPHIYEAITEGFDLGDPDTVAADTFDFFNDFQHSISDRRFSYSDKTLERMASVDNRLSRAILVSLGRSFFTQEIPYSFFEEHFFNDTYTMLDDEWYIDDYEFLPLMEPYYSRDDMLSDFYSTMRPWKYDSVDNVTTWEDMRARVARGYEFFELDPVDTIKNGDIRIRMSFLTLTAPVLNYPTNSEYFDGHDYYTFEIEPVEADDNPALGYVEFDSPALYDLAYENLPDITVACLTAARYNNQFYAGCRYTSANVNLYRDLSNGAITMDLSDEDMAAVVTAFENAGYPLMTDENGRIVPESPAHYREVYGEEYTDVLAEYGLI